MAALSLSTWSQGIVPSPTLAVDAKAKKLKAAGEDICGFGAGEPDFDTPDFIKEACSQALDQGKTGYAPSSGIPELRAALAEKYTNEIGLDDIQPSQVVVSPGGKFSCYLAILAVCSPGDNVIIPAPYWVSYPEMVKLAGASPKIITAGSDNNFKITPEQLEEAIDEKTQMLVLNSPSNPTGAVYTKAELEALMEVALRHNIWVMSDEIYEYLLYDDATHHSPAGLAPEAAASVITVGGFSKSFAMTGWRLGTLLAPAAVAKAVSDLQSQMTSNATSFAQYGALAALQNHDAAKAALQKMLKVFDRRRLKLYDGLNALSGITCNRSQGAFYLFPNVADCGLSSSDFSEQLLEKQKVAVVPGIAFGDDACVRLSYATSDAVIEKGLNRLGEFVQQL